jgi:hypothetical protein
MDYFAKAKTELTDIGEELGDSLKGKSVSLHYGSPFLAILGQMTPQHKVEYPAPLGFSVSEDLYHRLEDISYLIFEEVLCAEKPSVFLVANAKRPYLVAWTISRLAEENGYCVLTPNGELLKMKETALKSYMNRFCYI